MIWNGKNLKEILKYLSSYKNYGIVEMLEDNSIVIKQKDREPLIIKIGDDLFFKDIENE